MSKIFRNRGVPRHWRGSYLRPARRIKTAWPACGMPEIPLQTRGRARPARRNTSHALNGLQVDFHPRAPAVCKPLARNLHETRPMETGATIFFFCDCGGSVAVQTVGSPVETVEATCFKCGRDWVCERERDGWKRHVMDLKSSPKASRRSG